MNRPRCTSPHDTAVAVVGALVVSMVATTALAVVVLDRSDGAGSAGAGGATCLPPAASATAGDATFTIANSTDQGAEVRLTSAARDVTYARVDGLAPGATRRLDVALAPGGYVWSCTTADGAVSTSDSFTVAAPVDGSSRHRPVTAAELDAAVGAYRASLGTPLAALVVAVDDLRAAAVGRDLGAARAAWLRGHLDYERMGAAYGTFGELDTAINGRPDGLEGGADDPELTGFHRIERLLWASGGVDWAAVQAATEQLADDVVALGAEFPVLFTDPADLPLRAHEILEGSLQFELNDLSDLGSGSSLATVRANVDGTRLVLAALDPVLAPRAPELVAGFDARLDELESMLDDRRRPDGSWVPLAEVPVAEQRRIDALVGRLVEDLAAVPGLLSIPTASS